MAGLSRKRPLCNTVQFFSPKIRGAWGGSHDPNSKLADFKICRDASYIVSNFSQWIFYYDFIFKNLFLEKKEIKVPFKLWSLNSSFSKQSFNQSECVFQKRAGCLLHIGQKMLTYLHKYQNTSFSILLLKVEFCHSLSLKSLN